MGPEAGEGPIVETILTQNSQFVIFRIASSINYRFHRHVIISFTADVLNGGPTLMKLLRVVNSSLYISRMNGGIVQKHWRRHKVLFLVLCSTNTFNDTIRKYNVRQVLKT